MIPKVIGRPVYSYHLATIGFWTYALFSSWTGMQRLVDGPFPAWMITASIAATILTIIPVATVGLNHHMTMQGYFPVMRYSPTLRFTVFGGLTQGADQNDTSMTFIESVASVLPYVRGRTVAALLLTVSHFIFAFHFGLMLFGLGRTSTVPTFLNPVETEGSEEHL